MTTLRITAAFPLIFLMLPGCDGGPRVVPVKGQVTRGGQPFKARLLVTFYPDGDGRPSTALTDADGHFELRFDRDTKGAAIGMHKVVVAFKPAGPQEEAEFLEGRRKFHPDQDFILQKFGKRETTDLLVEISVPTNDLELKLD